MPKSSRASQDGERSASGLLAAPHQLFEGQLSNLGTVDRYFGLLRRFVTSDKRELLRHIVEVRDCLKCLGVQ